MKKFRFGMMIFLFIVIILSGILKVNIEYYRKNGKEAAEAAYKGGSNYDYPQNKIDFYSEINLFRKEGKKLKIYYRKDPFDLRFDVGSYVMYINSEVYNNIIEEKNRIMIRLRDIIDNSVRSIKTVTVKMGNTLRGIMVRNGEEVNSSY